MIFSDGSSLTIGAGPTEHRMDGVVLTVQLDQLGAKVGTDAGEHLAKGAQMLAGQHPADTWSRRLYVDILSHRPNGFSGRLVRYRYRIDPTPSQRQALA